MEWLKELTELMDALQEQFDKIKGRNDLVTLRIRRALSWGNQGLKAAQRNDPDIAFMLLWTAFNSMYGAEAADYQESTERQDFQDFMAKVVGLDHERSVYEAMWQRWPLAKKDLITNKFVFNAYWKHESGVTGFNTWELDFEEECQRSERAHTMRDGWTALKILFDRLYVLRNQLHHGSATYRGGLNRQQVKAGAVVMATLVPRFIGSMTAHPDEDWGKPYHRPDWTR